MAEFRCKALAELTRQLMFAPPGRRREEIDRAEQLYWQIEPRNIYPIEYLVYRITGHRAGESAGEATLAGAAVREDLLTMVERLSDSLDESVDRYDPRPLSVEEVAKQLKITQRTIARYRREGLFARRLVYPNGRKKLAFLPGSVRRFVEEQPRRVEEAAKFERIDEATRHEIILRARKIGSRVSVSPFRVAQYLSRKYGRSIETVRRLLVSHDKHDPRFAVFRDHRGTLTQKQREEIYRQYRRGVSVAKIAKGYGKTREAIHHAINLQRAGALRALNLQYVLSPTFRLPDAEQVILGTVLPNRRGRQDKVDKSNDLPAGLRELLNQPMPDAATEKAWFARYNYVKFHARRIVDQLDEQHLRAGQLDEAETLVRHADELHRWMVRAYMRVAVAVARSHQTSQPSESAATLLELIRQGEGVLAEAIEEFDFTKTGRFSTYLRWALMRRFAQAPAPGSIVEKPVGGTVDKWGDRKRDERVLSELLGTLDERQRLVLTRHFGLGDEKDVPAPQTLAAVGKMLNITAARARQIERRAIKQMREAAIKSGIDLDAMLPQSSGRILK